VRLQGRRLGRDFNLRWGEHPQEVRRQLAASLPELQPHDLPRAGIKFSQAGVGFLGHRGAWIVVLEANPSDIHTPHFTEFFAALGEVIAEPPAGTVSEVSSTKTLDEALAAAGIAG
jgi:hypothetical protein